MVALRLPFSLESLNSCSIKFRNEKMVLEFSKMVSIPTSRLPFQSSGSGKYRVPLMFSSYSPSSKNPKFSGASPEALGLPPQTPALTDYTTAIHGIYHRDSLPSQNSVSVRFPGTKIRALPPTVGGGITPMFQQC